MPRRSRPTVLTVVGARPQFVKAAPLGRALRRQVREVLVHTGQHYDKEMSEAFFEDLGIPRPDHHLGIGGSSHGRMTGQMLAALEDLLLAERPDLVVVLGDTNSTLAGALAASKLHIPVAHVEAGLRSFDLRMPEEVNRRLTDHISALLLCPTPPAVENLRREGITRGVHRVGDVMQDAVLEHLARARARKLRPTELPRLGYVLATIHRQDNTDDPARLAAILGALGELPWPVLLPLHPRTKARLAAQGLTPGRNIEVLPPAGYLEMLLLLEGARGVFTDSGGVQKEAFILGTPCVTLRDRTEWVETVEAGANVIVGADPRKIRKAGRELAERPRKRAPAALYGGGHTSERIARRIARFLS